VIVSRAFTIGVIATGVGTVIIGVWLFRDLRNQRHETPRLQVTGTRHETGQGAVSFRVLIPESRARGVRRTSDPPLLNAEGGKHPGFLRAEGFVFSQPKIEDNSGRIHDVSLIRYVTPANEPSLGIFQENLGVYRLRLEVSFEETGPAGWMRRLRNCWRLKTLRPLGETTFGEPVSIASDWITNSAALHFSPQR